MDFNQFANKRYKFGIVGLGLIGGSLAKALREAFNSSVIVAFNRREDPRKMAYEEKVADIVTGQIDDSFRDCDYIYLCTPVEYNEDYLKKLIPYIGEKTIITDVGSTKTSIHKEVEKLASEGFSEVILTGIHVASYGADLKTHDLADIIDGVNQIDGIRRIRLSSIEPMTLNTEFTDRIAKSKKLCHHFHISLHRFLSSCSM